MKIFRIFLQIAIFICILTLTHGCAETMENPQSPQFTLEWEDHFDTFDSNRWKKATHTFPHNIAQFIPENVTFQNGTMRLHLNKQKTAQRDIAGAEYRTKKKYSYGRFVVSAKFPKGSGIVTSFFTYRNPPRPQWQEIDVEVLGKDTSRVQFTYFWDWPAKHIAKTFDLPFTTDDGFHEYAFEWIPGQVTWYVDGQKMYTATDENIPSLAQEIMMNIWINDDPEWAGETDLAALPTYAEYNYVKYYSLK